MSQTVTIDVNDFYLVNIISDFQPKHIQYLSLQSLKVYQDSIIN